MLSGYEPLFLSHTRSLLEHSLAHVDKLVYYMWGSVILISYYMRVGRVIEAHNIISVTGSRAVRAGILGGCRSEIRRYPRPVGTTVVHLQGGYDNAMQGQRMLVYFNV